MRWNSLKPQYERDPTERQIDNSFKNLICISLIQFNSKLKLGVKSVLSFDSVEGYQTFRI